MSKLSENVIDLSNVLVGFTIYELVYGRWDNRITEFRNPLNEAATGLKQTQQSIETRKLISNQLEQDQFGFDRMMMTIGIILLIILSYIMLNALKNHMIRNQNHSILDGWIYMCILLPSQAFTVYLMNSYMGHKQAFILSTAFLLSNLGYYYYIKNNDVVTLGSS